MRRLLVIFCALLSITSKAQNEEALNKHRLQYKADLAKDIKADTSKVDFFPFEAQFIITATVEVLKDEPTFQMITSSGMKKEAQRYILIHFSYNGHDYNLTGYQLTKLKSTKEYSDHFFVPFKDATSGIETYSAGRYIDFTAKDITDNKLVIDFNKAYNPYCAFTDGYNCPIPPKENSLPMAVTAGEKKYLGKHISK